MLRNKRAGVCGDALMFTLESCDFQRYVERAMGIEVKVLIKEKIRKQDREKILTGTPEGNGFLRDKYMGGILDN